MKRRAEIDLLNSECKKVKTFDDFYEVNNNWMDEHTNYMDFLKSFYLSYFQKDAPDYEKIKEDILAPYTKKGDNKAHEVFKSLFKMPFITTETIVTYDLERIESEFGANIQAHGVEEAKGGMYNLLLMCISNQIRVSAAYWGPFISGMPNISPVRHGPYYLIYSMPGANQSAVPCSNAKLSDVARILVPFQKNKDILTDKLEQMVQVNLIDSLAKDLFLDKLVTYQELLAQLRCYRASESPFQVQKSEDILFFKPLQTIVPGAIEDKSLTDKVCSSHLM